MTIRQCDSSSTWYAVRDFPPNSAIGGIRSRTLLSLCLIHLRPTIRFLLFETSKPVITITKLPNIVLVIVFFSSFHTLSRTRNVLCAIAVITNAIFTRLTFTLFVTCTTMIFIAGNIIYFTTISSIIIAIAITAQAKSIIAFAFITRLPKSPLRRFKTIGLADSAMFYRCLEIHFTSVGRVTIAIIPSILTDKTRFSILNATLF